MADVDFSYRVSRKYKNYYTPLARSYNNCRITKNQFQHDLFSPLSIKSHIYHFRKNIPKSIINYLALGLCLLHLKFQNQLTQIIEILSALKHRLILSIGIS